MYRYQSQLQNMFLINSDLPVAAPVPAAARAGGGPRAAAAPARHDAAHGRAEAAAEQGQHHQPAAAFAGGL